MTSHYKHGKFCFSCFTAPAQLRQSGFFDHNIATVAHDLQSCVSLAVAKISLSSFHSTSHLRSKGFPSSSGECMACSDPTSAASTASGVASPLTEKALYRFLPTTSWTVKAATFRFIEISPDKRRLTSEKYRFKICKYSSNESGM